jgi:hypothetical protein
MLNHEEHKEHEANPESTAVKTYFSDKFLEQERTEETENRRQDSISVTSVSSCSDTLFLVAALLPRCALCVLCGKKRK